jgi:hypothetical protein
MRKMDSGGWHAVTTVTRRDGVPFVTCGVGFCDGHCGLPILRAPDGRYVRGSGGAVCYVLGPRPVEFKGQVIELTDEEATYLTDRMWL